MPQGVFAVMVAMLQVAAAQVRPLAPVWIGLIAVSAAGVAGLLALSLFTGTPMALLTRDMAATAGVKFYIGALSNLGALLWAASTSVCLLAATALWTDRAGREPARFLAGAAALQGALGLDDFFMLHEVVYPKVGLEEQVLVLLYGVALAALLWRFRAVILRSELLLLLIGAALFVGSAAADAFARDQTALEDILKVTAVMVWLTYFWRLSLQQLLAPDPPHR